jgi:hypothetical protein
MVGLGGLGKRSLIPHGTRADPEGWAVRRGASDSGCPSPRERDKRMIEPAGQNKCTGQAAQGAGQVRSEKQATSVPGPRNTFPPIAGASDRNL